MQRLTTCVFLAALGATLSAQQFTIPVEMIGGQESPPNTSGGIGSATVTVDVTTNAMSVTGTYSNLSMPVTVAHIHSAATTGTRRGANGGVILGLTVSGGTSGTLTGSGTLTAAQMALVLDGLAYVNVHSGMFSGGEIRGQIDAVPGSGSPGAPAATITGAATAGGTLTVGSPPSIGNPVILVGAAMPFGAVTLLPGSLSCVANTNIGFDIGVPFFALPGSTAILPIPAGIPNAHVAIQVALVSLSGCIDLSAATRIAFRP